MRTCDLCGKPVKHLTDHKRRMHKETKKDEPKVTSVVDPIENENSNKTPEKTVQKFTVAAPKEKVKSDQYYCIDCGQPIKYKQDLCSCGASLDWGGF